MGGQRLSEVWWTPNGGGTPVNYWCPRHSSAGLASPAAGREAYGGQLPTGTWLGRRYPATLPCLP